MCVLRVSSEVNSFVEFLDNSSLKAYDCFEKGEACLGKRSPYSYYGFKCSVSEKDWDDFKGQIADAVVFLQKNFTELERLVTENDVDDIRLDFPVESRLEKQNLIAQSDYLPPGLIKLAGKIGVGIEISLYCPSEENMKNE